MNPDDVVEILLVEDDPDDVKLTLHTFAKFNITNKLHVVTDGAAALDFIFCTGPHAGRSINNPPKVVLLDIKLPKINGLEVLRRVRADPRTTGLPIVLLTSSQEDSDVADGYQNHANSYIVKPVDFENFGYAIRELGLYWLVLNATPRTGPDSAGASAIDPGGGGSEAPNS
ncbi:MAG: response regulator [Candidatus Dormibacteria bacterium]